jgi:tRNA(His) 5'-end guanylyltransferase
VARGVGLAIGRFNKIDLVIPDCYDKPPMNTTLLDRLRGFQIPATTPLLEDHFLVVRLQGVDFEGIIDSPDFGFTRPFDVRFGKMMVRTGSHLLGGDPCGRFGYVEQLELSMILDHRRVPGIWNDATELQTFLVGMASSKMSLLVEDEALFTCRLYAFSKSDLVVAYFMWRQQEAYLTALDRYCAYVLAKEGSSAESISKLMEDLGPLEKEEILRQNQIEYSDLPAWQRRGTAVSLGDGGKLVVDTNLPKDADYRPYLQKYLEF